MPGQQAFNRFAVLFDYLKVVLFFKGINSEVRIPLSFLLLVVLLFIIITFMEFEVFIHERIVDGIKILFTIFYLIVVFLVIYLYDILSKNYTQKLKEEVIKREKTIMQNRLSCWSREAEI